MCASAIAFALYTLVEPRWFVLGWIGFVPFLAALDRCTSYRGAVALGHPLGCTGAKLTATVLQELIRTGGRYGMVTMCVGGGQGAAGIFELIQ